MKSALPKVLHPLLGRTLLGHVLAAADAAARRPHASWWSVTAPTRSRAHLAEIAPDAAPVLQAEQRGTGHAVRIALDARAGRRPAPWSCSTATCRCCAPETVARAGRRARGGRRGGHRADRRGGRPDRARAGSCATPTARLDAHRRGARRDRRSSGRSARSTPASTPSTPALLREALGKLTTDNDQGEEYLTDVFGAARRRRRSRCAAHVAADPIETLGCNDRVELAALRALLRDRVNDALDARRGHASSTRRPPGST